VQWPYRFSHKNGLHKVSTVYFFEKRISKNLVYENHYFRRELSKDNNRFHFSDNFSDLHRQIIKLLGKTGTCLAGSGWKPQKRRAGRAACSVKDQSGHIRTAGRSTGDCACSCPEYP
jgi:hypothetical protein